MAQVPDFLVTLNNFEKAPKGTTIFLCDRTLWLNSQPESSDQMTNDDTRIFRQIVTQAPIQRANQISVSYRERTAFKAVLDHAYHRGPRFADYYLQAGGHYRALYIAIWLLLAIGLGFSLLQPLFIPLSVLCFLLILLLIAIYLSQNMLDILVILIYLPTIATAFGAGILKWQLRQLQNRK